MQELVSVVIPVYNRESTIKRAIDSVLCQTYSNMELIIVDDGSTDDTVRIINKYNDSRIKLICHKERGGANKARNTGIENANGEYIAFQDSDDEWLPDKLEVQIEMMKKDALLACYSAYNLCKDDSVRTIPADFQNIDKYRTGLQEILAEYNVVGTQTLVLGRGVLTKLGDKCFDEELPRMQDYDLAVRLTKVCEIGYINRPLVNVHRTAVSISTDFSAIYAAAAMLLAKHKGFFKVDRFIGSVAKLENGIDNPARLVEDINLLQEKAKLQDAECKDVILAYLAGKVCIQNELLAGQYYLAVDQLEDRKFLIYGAGKIGKDVYRSLKKKGLRPECFLVTNCEKEQFIDGIPVVSIDEWQNREDVVIISIAAEHQVELMNNLITRKYKQFFVYHKELT